MFIKYFPIKQNYSIIKKKKIQLFVKILFFLLSLMIDSLAMQLHIRMYIHLNFTFPLKNKI